MKNVKAIEYAEKYNNEKVIRPFILENLPEITYIQKRLEKQIEGIISPSGETTLGIFFTNYEALREGLKKVPWGLTVGVFPLIEEKIQYEIKKGDFLINLGRDPIIMEGMREGILRKINSYLLFSKNPYTHQKEYRDIEKLLRK